MRRLTQKQLFVAIVAFIIFATFSVMLFLGLKKNNSEISPSEPTPTEDTGNRNVKSATSPKNSNKAPEEFKFEEVNETAIAEREFALENQTLEAENQDINSFMKSYE